MATEVVILVPPAAPTNIFTSPLLSSIIDGHMDDRGRLPGLIKFAGEGATLKKLVLLGEEKSSISLFKIMPVLFEIIQLPKLHNETKKLTYYTIHKNRVSKK